MTGSPQTDPLDALDRDRDPLREAEERVRKAEVQLDILWIGVGFPHEYWKALNELTDARADLAALRSRLATEAEEPLPFREGMK